MYQFVKDFDNQYKIKLYEEIFGDPETANVVDLQDNNKLVLKHYHIKKIIPSE
jgi:hypothetical protein